MESIRKYYIPNACISFTILVLFQSAVNALRGRDGAGFGRFCLEVGLCILLVCAVDFIVERFNFRSVRGMLAGKYIAECAAMLLLGFLFGWFEAGAAGILEPVLLFSCVFAAINYRVHSMNRREEEKLNRIIREKLGK